MDVEYWLNTPLVVIWAGFGGLCLVVRLHWVLFHVAGMESNVPGYYIFLKNVNVPVPLVGTLGDRVTQKQC